MKKVNYNFIWFSIPLLLIVFKGLLLIEDWGRIRDSFFFIVGIVLCTYIFNMVLDANTKK